jgi:hypothetical protein
MNSYSTPSNYIFLIKRDKEASPMRRIDETIMVEIRTPNETAIKDFLIGNPRIQAPRVPVYAPVIGKGIATKRVIPKRP